MRLARDTRFHQALGVCWCGSPHSIDDAVRMNVTGQDDAPTVSGVLIADALVEYALRHVDDLETVQRCADALVDLDYPDSAQAILRYGVLVHEHSVKP